jgi:uncharacterized surface protein with fasciclin (FAS1) repeats
MLLYHVVDGKVLAADVVGLDVQAVVTLSGETVNVMVDGENVMINESTVIITDIEASNGVIHVIDAVLVPELGRQDTYLLLFLTLGLSVDW